MDPQTFEHQCQALVMCHEMKRRGWTWKGEYAEMIDDHVVIRTMGLDREVDFGDLEEFEDVEDIESSVQTVTNDHQQGLEIYSMKYHIVYNEVFQVPTLYFNIYDGNNQLLQPDQVVQVFKLIGQERGFIPKSDEFNPYTFITQGEHPVLQTIYYYIHPCETKSLMQSIGSNPKNYVYSWLSFIGKAICLNIPIIEEYIK